MITFTGKYTSRLDSKARIVLPAGIKKEIPEGYSRWFVLEKDIHEKSIVVYPMEIWEERIELLKKRVNFNDRLQTKMLSRFFEEVVKIQMAENGRINIPSQFLEYAQLTSDVLITGHGDRIRLWNPAMHEEYSLSDEEYSNMYQQLLGGNLTTEEFTDL